MNQTEPTLKDPILKVPITLPHDKLSHLANQYPHRKAVICPQGSAKKRRHAYVHITYGELNRESEILAGKLIEKGIKDRMRVFISMPPGIEFIIGIYALFKAGAIPVIFPPAIEKRKMLDCLRASACQGALGPYALYLLKLFNPGTFESIKHLFIMKECVLSENDKTLPTPDKDENEDEETSPATDMESTALIFYSSGHYDIPKGVLYSQRELHFAISHIKSTLNMTSHSKMICQSPFEAVLNPCLGVTTIFTGKSWELPPTTDISRLVDMIDHHGVTHLSISPTLLYCMGYHLSETGRTLSSIEKIAVRGAHVLPRHLENVLPAFSDEMKLDITYDTLESSFISAISAKDFLSSTTKLTDQGFGTCLGWPAAPEDIRLIKIIDSAVAEWSDQLMVASGDVGEIAVSGNRTSKGYVEGDQENIYAKIYDHENRCWHRTGDLAWEDSKGRLWYCGRKKDRVITDKGGLYTANCEAIFNTHPEVERSALIGIGEIGNQTPIICIETARKLNKKKKKEVMEELIDLAKSSEATKNIENVIFVDALPVDRYHETKIQRSDLSAWAEEKFLKA